MQIIIVYLAYMHMDVKWYTKALLLLILLYVLSPIDFIPGFIPVLGMLDDFILIPAGIFITVKMILKSVWDECRLQAENRTIISGKYKKAGAAIAIIWIIIIPAVVIKII
ncbi:MAG: YkvA family protein [Eubacteriales bacterium]